MNDLEKLQAIRDMQEQIKGISSFSLEDIWYMALPKPPSDSMGWYSEVHVLTMITKILFIQMRMGENQPQSLEEKFRLIGQRLDSKFRIDAKREAYEREIYELKKELGVL